MASNRTRTNRGRGGRGRAPARRNRRRLTITLAVAAAVVVAVTIVIVAANSGDDNTTTGTTNDAGGAFVGGDLHSLVALADGRLFVGGHQGVAVSRDQGRTWQAINTLANADAMGWGQQNGTLFVSGHPGLNRATTGTAFRRINDGLPDTDMHAFGAGKTVLYGAGPNLGVVASTDGGDSWQPRSNDGGRAFFGRILVDPDDDQHLIAADAQSGPQESRDGGRTWRTLDDRPAVWVSSPDGGHTIYASGQAATVSRDGGRTWSSVQLPDGAQLVEAVPSIIGRLYAAGLDGTNARVWASTDDGATWTAP